MNKKQILIFSHEFPPFGGGAGIVAKFYANKLADEGAKVTVLTRKIDNLDYHVQYTIKAVKTLPKLWFMSYINAVNFSSYDRIILNDISSIYCAGIFFTRQQLAKSVVFLHGDEPESIFENPNILRKITRFKFFYTQSLFFGKIVAVTIL